jgi:hypothetical protein
VLRGHAEAVGRDMADIEISAQIRVARDDLPDARQRAEALVAAGVEHLIMYLDGREGAEMLDLVASEVVAPLRDAFA